MSSFSLLWKKKRFSLVVERCTYTCRKKGIACSHCQFSPGLHLRHRTQSDWEKTCYMVVVYSLGVLFDFFVFRWTVSCFRGLFFLTISCNHDTSLFWLVILSRNGNSFAAIFLALLTFPKTSIYFPVVLFCKEHVRSKLHCTLQFFTRSLDLTMNCSYFSPNNRPYVNKQLFYEKSISS